MTSARAGGGTGNSTRGIFMGGSTNPSGAASNVIDQITIASEGNVVDFGGQCVVAGGYRGGSGCTKTRMVYGVGSSSPSIDYSNTLEFIVINSNGNAQDFGDLTSARSSPGGLSDSNGGLGGF